MHVKEEREVRRYESIGKPGDPYLPTCHIYGGTEGESMVRATDYDAASRKVKDLEALLAPRTYNPNIEPVICPACGGAMDDHRGNCPVEAYQLTTVLDELTAANQRIRELEEQLNSMAEDAYAALEELRIDLQGTEATACRMKRKAMEAEEWIRGYVELILKGHAENGNLRDELATLQQQTQRLVEAAVEAIDPEDDPWEAKQALREALKPFQKGEANAIHKKG